MHIMQVGIVILLLSIPFMAVGKFLGDPHPVRFNAADNIGFVGFMAFCGAVFMIFVGMALAIVGM